MLGFDPAIELIMLRMCTVEPPAGYVSHVIEAAAANDLDPLLLASVVVTETRCDADAIGAAGEIGLMQIHPVTWQQQEYNATRLHDCTGLVWSDMHDPALNLQAGAWILATAIKANKGSLRHGLALYNGYSEAGLAYADKVLARYARASAQVP